MEQQLSCVHTQSPLHCGQFSPIWNLSWHTATTCEQGSRNTTKEHRILRADNRLTFLYFSGLSFLQSSGPFFCNAEVTPRGRVCKHLPCSPLPWGCAPQVHQQLWPSLTPAPSSGGCFLTGGLCSWTLFAAAEPPAQLRTLGSPPGTHAAPPGYSQHWREIPATELIKNNRSNISCTLKVKITLLLSTEGSMPFSVFNRKRETGKCFPAMHGNPIANW